MKLFGRADTDQAPEQDRFGYQPYRFGRSQQLYRGPPPDLSGKFVACIGGTETFGTYVRTPYPTLLAEALGQPVANLGAEGAGPGFFAEDVEVLDVLQRARVTVVQVMGAHELSNRFYTVRPRRNQRLHEVSPMLRELYPEVEFGRYSRVAGLVRALSRLDAERFQMVETELRSAWVGRMSALLNTIGGEVLLLWLSQRAPEEALAPGEDTLALPSLVDRDMVDAVARFCSAYVPCVSRAGLPQDLTVGGQPVLFRPKGDPIFENRTFPSPEMHRKAADLLLPVVKARIALR